MKVKRIKRIEGGEEFYGIDISDFTLNRLRVLFNTHPLLGHSRLSNIEETSDLLQELSSINYSKISVGLEINVNELLEECRNEEEEKDVLDLIKDIQKIGENKILIEDEDFLYYKARVKLCYGILINRKIYERFGYDVKEYFRLDYDSTDEIIVLKNKTFLRSIDEYFVFDTSDLIFIIIEWKKILENLKKTNSVLYLKKQ